MGNTTLGEITLDNGTNARITDNSLSKDPNLSPLPLYLNDSDQTDVFEGVGVVKAVNLSGTYSDSSVANLKTFIDSIEALAQGHQDTDAGYPIDFVDDLRGTLKVKVLSVGSSWSIGEPTRVTWTIKLVQSSTNS
jgi:hypothetical protein